MMKRFRSLASMTRLLLLFLRKKESLNVRVIALLLAAFSFLIYSDTISHGYNMDDVLVTKGHRFTSMGFEGILEIFKSSYYEDDLGYSYEYRPITHVSFAIEHGLFGERVWVSHLINSLLHTVTVILVFLVCHIMFPTSNLMFPILAALLFAAHTMHVEVVASVKNRDELLSLLFVISALGISIRAVVMGRSLNWLLVPPLLILSLLSKFSSAAFLVLIPLSSFFGPAEARHRSILIALVCTVVPLFVFFWSREILLYRALYLAFAISSPYLLYLSWSIASVVDYSKVVKVFRPKGWPKDGHFGSITAPIRISPLELAYVGLTGLIVMISVLFDWYSVSVALAGMLLLKPFWTGRNDLSSPILICVLLSLLSTRQVVEGATFLMLIYATLSYIEQGIQQKRYAYGLLFLAVIPVFMKNFFSLGTDWDFVDFLEPIPSLGPFVLALWFSKSHKWLVVGIWVMYCTAQSVGLALHARGDDFFILAGSLIFLIHCAKLWPRWKLRPPHAIRILLFFSLIFAFYPSSTVSQYYGDVGNNGRMNGSDTELSDSYSPDRESVNVPQDRPLAFSEYPLGIDATVGERIGTVSLVLGHYLVKMFIPWPQAFYYGYDEVPLGDWINPLAILSLFVHAVLLLLAIYFGRSHPILAFGILAYLSSIFLFSNFIATIPGMIGDRLTYVASFGFCISLGYVLTMVYQRLSTVIAKRVFAVAVGALMVTWSGMTISRAAKWKDPLTLMRHDIHTVPNSAQAHNLLASNLMQASYDAKVKENPVDMRHEAIHHFRESLRIWPQTLNVWYDLGRAYMTVNEPARALPCFRSAYGFDSTFTDAAWSAALIAEQLGRDSIAIQYYNHCIRFSPELEEAYSRLSYLYFTKEEFERSIEVSRMAIAHEPRWPAPYENVAQALVAMEMPDSAAQYIGLRNKMLGMP